MPALRQSARMLTNATGPAPKLEQFGRDIQRLEAGKASVESVEHVMQQLLRMEGKIDALLTQKSSI